LPTIVYTRKAQIGFLRCRQFLQSKNPLAAQRASAAIDLHLDILSRHPEAGRPLDDLPELRELLIPFGDAGYVMLYRHLPERDAVVLLAFRHQREAGH
jgi:plasmid stabilization system protein ParE